MADREGAIWVTGEPGLARIETPSPASFFDATDGFAGYFNTPGTMAGSIWRRSRRDLPASGGPRSRRRFSRLTGHRQPVLVVRGHGRPRDAACGLAVACSDGLYEIQGLTTRPIRAPADGTYRTSALLRSRVDPTRLWVALFDGLASFRWVDGRWIDEGRVEGASNRSGPVRAGTGRCGPAPAPGRAAHLLRDAPHRLAAPGAGDRRAIRREEGLQTTVCSSTASAAPCTSPAGPAAGTSRRPGIRRRTLRQRSRVRVSCRRRLPASDLPACRMAGCSSTSDAARRCHPYADGSWTFDSSAFSLCGQAPGSRRSSPAASCGSAAARTSSASTCRDGRLRRQPPSRRWSGGWWPIGSRPLRWCRGPRVTASAVRRRRCASSTPRRRFSTKTATEYQTRLEGLDDDWTAWYGRPGAT